MRNKHIKIIQHYGPLGKCKLKITMRYYIPIGKAKMKNMCNTNTAKDVGKLNLLYIAGGNISCNSQPGKYLAVSLKTKHAFTKEPSSCLLDIYFRKMKTYIYTKTCTRMSIATLFIRVQTENN